MPKKRADQQTMPDGTPLDWRAVFLTTLRANPDVAAAARAAGVSRQYVYEVRANDRAFAKAWAEAHASSVDALEGKAHQLALGGDRAMLMFLLTAHRREVYGKQQEIKHSGNVGLRVPEVVEGLVRLGHDRQEVIAALRAAASQNAELHDDALAESPD